MKFSIVHLIPYDGIGGVEAAARTTLNGNYYELFNFRVDTIFPSEQSDSRVGYFSPSHFISIVINLLKSKPDVLIVSLWRAYLVGIIIKMLRKKTKLVVFLHLPSDVHWIDFLVTRVAARLSSKIWADSTETLVHRLPRLPAEKCRVISFVTDHVLPIANLGPVKPLFIFWGRIHRQKNLARAVRLFAEIHSRVPGAEFCVIGPDGGDLSSLKKLISELDLDAAIKIFGPMTFCEIRRHAASASFYLQTSTDEGMAMSVVEAMQLGLLPVVTPVGEIPRYTCAGKNAVVVRDDSAAVAEVLALLKNDDRYQAMRKIAISTWSGKALYKEDVFEAGRELLSQ